ncbi:hypothetical protein DENSPDRAFT_926267 [Dentipellis sp. KUC8613]|nr:hypothetical protein DENSPDRAFT_926267 [Dentipellis sp. KUC8613]
MLDLLLHTARLATAFPSEPVRTPDASQTAELRILELGGVAAPSATSAFDGRFDTSAFLRLPRAAIGPSGSVRVRALGTTCQAQLKNTRVGTRSGGEVEDGALAPGARTEMRPQQPMTVARPRRGAEWERRRVRGASDIRPPSTRMATRPLLTGASGAGGTMLARRQLHHAATNHGSWRARANDDAAGLRAERYVFNLLAVSYAAQWVLLQPRSHASGFRLRFCTFSRVRMRVRTVYSLRK